MADVPFFTVGRSLAPAAAAAAISAVGLTVAKPTWWTVLPLLALVVVACALVNWAQEREIARLEACLGGIRLDLMGVNEEIDRG